MKRYIYPLLTLLLLLCLAACGGTADNTSAPPAYGADPTPYGAVNTLPGVELGIVEDTLTPTGLTVQVYNGSSEALTFGSSFYLETQLDGEWYPVSYLPSEHAYAFSSEGYDILPDESYAFAIDWDWIYGEIAPGKLRLVKDAVTGAGTGTLKEWYFAVEFTL